MREDYPQKSDEKVEETLSDYQYFIKKYNEAKEKSPYQYSNPQTTSYHNEIDTDYSSDNNYTASSSYNDSYSRSEYDQTMNYDNQHNPYQNDNFYSYRNYEEPIYNDYYKTASGQYYSNEEKQEYFDSYSRNYNSNDQLTDISSTQTTPSIFSESGNIQRNVSNSQYILYGQNVDDHISETREMTSVSKESSGVKKNLIGGSAQETRGVKKEAHRKNRIKAKKNKMVFRFVWVFMVIIAGVVLGGYLSNGAGDVFAMNRKSEGRALITLKEGATLDDVADLLLKNSIIDNKEFFKLYCTFTNADSFKQGEFEIPTNMDYEAIINYLWSDTNRTDVVKIMFYEGMNVLEMADALEEAEICKASDFLAAANSDKFDADYELIGRINNESEKYYKLEGYLFPDTYEFYKNSEVSDVIEKLLFNNENKILTEDMEAAAQEMGLTMDELVIFASLVQAEASSEEDMYKVSSVIHNRLNYGADYDIYTLGMESTLYYPYRSEKSLPADKIGYESKYSTYTVQGLPAGAVCNPGLKAFDAVLHPADTNYLYFLHGPDGQSYYASTLEEHKQNYIEAGLEEYYTE